MSVIALWPTRAGMAEEATPTRDAAALKEAISAKAEVVE
tara:strand:+ start:190 stop:306 length:117 start_codon:yes stop_codon:yes gene_type:complete